MYYKLSPFKISDSDVKSIGLDIWDDDDDMHRYIIATFNKGVYELKYMVRSNIEQCFLDFLIDEQVVVIEQFNKNEKIYKMQLTSKALLNAL